MATVTALDLITATLRKLGVQPLGEDVPAEEAMQGLDELNRLLETWQLQRRLVYRVQELTHTLTPGLAHYSIGPGGFIAAARPVHIQTAFTRMGNQDYHIEVITQAQYASIGLKSQGVSWPQLLYYEPAFPLGVVHLWGVPGEAGILHLGVGVPLTPLTEVSDRLSLPPGYRDGLIYGLGKRLAPGYGVVLGDEFMAEARQIMKTLKQSNARRVTMDLDPRLPGADGQDAGWIVHGGFL